MESTVEFLTGRAAGREGQRRWADEVKAQIVSESLRPGVTVHEVAERYGLKPNHLSSWRTLARRGQLVLPAPDGEAEFAAMIVAPPTADLALTEVGCSEVGVSRPEIIVGSVTIRLEEGASAARIVAIARSLAASA